MKSRGYAALSAKSNLVSHEFDRRFYFLEAVNN